MFTGIIEATALVKKSARRRGALVLTIQTPRGWRLKPGQSLDTNGACLTVSKVGKSFYQTELMGETLARTTFGKTIPARVNLERSLTLQSPLDGHLVLGHADTVGRVASIIRQSGAVVYRISFPKKFSPLVAAKGSIAIDGVSLTVVQVGRGWCSVALVGYTLERTTLGEKRVGGLVNVEFDVLAKYVSRLLS